MSGSNPESRNKKISFCIPTYNRAHYLKRCLESIISAIDSEIEVIVQDNCSPDNTGEIVSSFSDERIRYFRNEENIGLVQNQITIIERASGEYIYYVTDDDCLLPGAVDKIRSFIETHRPYFFTSDILTYLEKQKKAYNYSYFGSNRVCSKDQKDDISRIFLSAHVLTRVCFKKEALDMAFLRRHGDNWYPSMLIALMMYLKGPLAYLAEPTGLHTWENETFWDLDVNNNEVLNQGVVNIIKSVADKIDREMVHSLVYNFSVDRGYLADDLRELIDETSIRKVRKALRKTRFREKTRRAGKGLKQNVKSMERSLKDIFRNISNKCQEGKDERR